MNLPAFYVCPPIVPKRFAGTALGRCQLCSQQVQYKPGGPELAETLHGRPVTMICIPCATRQIPVGLERVQ